MPRSISSGNSSKPNLKTQEHGQKLMNFLCDKDDRSSTMHRQPGGTANLDSVPMQLKKLDEFMKAVTDARLAKEAQQAWEGKH